MRDGAVVGQYTTANSRLADDNVYRLFQDERGLLWIGTLFGCLQTLVPESGEWTDYPRECKNEGVVMDFAPLGDGILLAGTLRGLSRIDVKTGAAEQILANRSGTPFLHQDVQSLLMDSRGLLWIAHGQGVTVWDVATDSLHFVTRRQGLCDDVVRSLCEDCLGRIWIGTSNGVSVVSVAMGGGLAQFSFDNYTTARGLLDNNISRHCVIRLRNGNIVVGGYEGYTLVDLGGEAGQIGEEAPYEIGEEWMVWTSWQAMTIYAALLLSVFATYLLMRRAKRRAVAKAVEKARAVWAKSPMPGDSLVAGQDEAGRNHIEVEPGKVEVTSRDEELVRKAVNVVERHISDDFSVEDLSREVGLTRGHLYKRLTALTGKTPMEFIRAIRMNRARQLLERSGMQVAEVAYAVGYSSPKIFSRNFKAEMGMTPTEYIKRQKDG